MYIYLGLDTWDWQKYQGLLLKDAWLFFFQELLIAYHSSTMVGTSEISSIFVELLIFFYTQT